MDEPKLSEFEEPPAIETTGEKTVASVGEEEGDDSLSSRGSPAATPVVLPQFQYSKDELMKIGKAPLAKKWPDFLDQAFSKSTGTWDPEKWFKSKRRSESPLVDDLRSKRERPAEFERSDGMGAFKRRTPDPKERIKEEKDDIVLSPQRRSFGTGCHVAPTVSHRPGSPLDSRETDSIHREPSRRIGSGRIVRDQRDWDKDHKDYGYGGGRNRFDRDEKENRYSGNSGGRYRTNDRRMGRGRSDDRIDEEEEPEWFSSGPTSQSETIELVGFEDEKKKCMDRPVRRTKDYFSRHKIVEESSKEAEIAAEELPPPRSPPKPARSEPQSETTGSTKSHDFDNIFNASFKMDWFLPNGTQQESGVQSQAGLGGSRFSQWFNRGESPTSKMMAMGQQPSSFPDDFPGAAHILRSGMGSPPNRQLDSGNTYYSQNVAASGERNIMEILQKANINCAPLVVNHDSHLKEQAMSGNVKCVEELEANLKLLVLGNNKKQSVDVEKSAFNKLVGHLTDSHHSPSPPASLSMGPLDKSKVLQEEDIIHNMYCTTSSPPDVRISPTPMLPAAGTTLMDLLKSTEKASNMTQDNRVSMMRKSVQQQQLPPQQQQNTLADLMRRWSGGQNSNDLLSRLICNQPSGGSISPRLSDMQAPCSNPVNPSANLTAMLQQRELLAAMVKEQHLTPSPEPLNIPHLSPRHSPLPQECTAVPARIPSPLVFGQQPPVLSHAPSPIHPAQVTHGNTLQVQSSPVLPRVPSPQELAVHTQSILHNALIKRKLEEQRENFIKRQEAQQRSRSPNPLPVSVSVPVPVLKNNPPVSPAKTVNSSLAAFTPTSVMRKMYSDRFDKDCIRTDLQNASANRLPVSPDLKVPCEPLHQHPNGGLNLMHMDTSPSRPVPRALHGQGSMHRQNQMVNPHLGPAQGRPIVKASGDPARPPKVGPLQGQPPTMTHNKQFSVPNTQASHLPDMDSMVRLVEQQQRLLNRQQAALAAQQRTLNASPMPPMNAGGFSLGPRAHHPNLLMAQPPPPAPLTAANNLNLPLLRSMVQANFNNPSLRAQSAPLNQLTQLSQLVALQQQQQQPPQPQPNRGPSLDPRQLRNLHPLALQQLLLNVQSQASGMMPHNNNIAAGRMEGGFSGAQGMKTLMPPCQPNTSRQSPVNLTRWFGNDVLKQKMPDMPPVPHQKALLVEEVERQQQSATVHN